MKLFPQGELPPRWDPVELGRNWKAGAEQNRAPQGSAQEHTTDIKAPSKRRQENLKGDLRSSRISRIRKEGREEILVLEEPG